MPCYTVHVHSWLEADVKFRDADVFDTLSHVTMIENTEKILQEGLKLQKVDDYSCVNKCNDDRGFHHPLQNVLFLWVGADKLQNFNVTRYGNKRAFLNDQFRILARHAFLLCRIS